MGYPTHNMLAYLNSYIILADTNVWINWKFRAAVKKSTVLQRQLRVPHLVADELKKKQEKDPELGKAAKDALKIIEKHEIRILDDTHLPFHHADPEFILYGMENAGDAVAVVTADNDLRDDLKALCPGVLILGWDIDAGQFALEGKPEYAELAKQYGKIIASSRAVGRKDFAVLAVMLGGELVETPSDTCSAGESASLLARVVLHRGKQRALLLLAEGEDTLPYMGHRDTKLKSVDNTGFDVAVMDARGGITVLEPKGEPLPCKKQQKAAPKPKASTTPATKPKATPATKPKATPAVKTKATPAAKTKATPATKSKATPAVKTAPSEDYPHCQKIRQALQRQELKKATQHIIEGLKMSLKNGRFVHVTKLLDVAEQHTLEISDDIVEVYICTILPRIESSKGMNQVMSRFTGKAGKKVLRRLIDQAHGTKAAETIVPKLEEWKNRSGMTDAQRNAIDAIIQHAKTKGSCGNLPEAP